MFNSLEARVVNAPTLAKDVDPDVLDLIRQLNPEIADEVQRVHTVFKRITNDEVKCADSVPVDYGVLLDFEYNGKKLTYEEMEFVATYIGNGFNSRRNLSAQTITNFVARPIVIMAMRELTKDAIRQYQVNPNKLMRELGNIVDGNISDVCDITAAGIVLKDFSTLPRHITGAVEEVHEIRNAQGVQIRVKMHDKMGAINTLTKVLGMLAPQVVDVNVHSELEVKLANAIARGKEPLMIEGECAKVDA